MHKKLSPAQLKALNHVYRFGSVGADTIPTRTAEILSHQKLILFRDDRPAGADLQGPRWCITRMGKDVLGEVAHAEEIKAAERSVEQTRERRAPVGGWTEGETD